MKFKKFIFKNVNSTNDIAIRLIRKTNNKFGIIVADKQKKAEEDLEENGYRTKVIYLLVYFLV